MALSERDSYAVATRANDIANARPRRSTEEQGLVFKGLCSNCELAHVFRRAGKMDVTVRCQAQGLEVPTDIEACSQHTPKPTDVTRHIMTYVMRALVVDPDNHSELDKSSIPILGAGR